MAEVGLDQEKLSNRERWVKLAKEAVADPRGFFQKIIDRFKTAEETQGNGEVYGGEIEVSADDMDVAHEAIEQSSQQADDLQSEDETYKGEIALDDIHIDAAREAMEEVSQEEDLTFRDFSNQETFDFMPILDGDEQRAFNMRAIEMYGEVRGNGKWGTVLVDDEKRIATKIYKSPDSRLNIYDTVFMSRNGGKAGLPSFEGFVPNGYRMEAIAGKTIADLIREHQVGETSSEGGGHLNDVLTFDQAQQILDLAAEYHSETGRVHGDLATSKGIENIIIQEDGTPRLIDTEWERIGEQTPQSEIDGLFEFFSETMDIKGLQKPNTITAEQADENLQAFKAEVAEMIDIDPVYKHRVLKFKDQDIVFKVDEGGQLLVSG